MFQRKYLIFLAALMLAALAWTAGWFWLENKLRNDIVGFVEAQAKNGMILDWSGINISGFPIRFSTSFKNPQAQWTIADRRVFWTGADISIRPFIEGPEIASFRSPGRHNFHILKNNNDLLIDINARDFEGRLYFDKLAHAVGLRGRAAPFTISLNGSPEITIAEATLNWARTNGATAEGGIYPDSAGDSISMVLKQIDLAALLIDPGVVQTLGTKIRTLSSQVALRGALDPRSTETESLTSWRNAGGTLEVENFNLIWGPLRIAGNGTLTVDQTLQPAATFSARVAGLDQLLYLLEGHGKIGQQQAAIARIALAVLTPAPANGAPPEASVHITIQDRVLSIGPIPLMKIDPIVWN
jgi:hypothetical protein